MLCGPSAEREAPKRTFYQILKFKRATKLARKTQKIFNIIPAESGAVGLKTRY
jgi:hypothetical protein